MMENYKNYVTRIKLKTFVIANDVEDKPVL